MRSQLGKNVIVRGYEKSGIMDGIKMGSSKLAELSEDESKWDDPNNDRNV